MAPLPLLMIEPMAFSAMLDKPPALLPGVVLAVRSTRPRSRYWSYQPSSRTTSSATACVAERLVSCSTASRTSVFSENITVPPERTIRSAM